MDQVHKFLNFWIFALIPVTSIFTLVYYGQRVNTGRCSEEKQSKSATHVCPTLNQKISTHNRIILHKPGDKNFQKYNYMNKNTQTINRNCFLKNILYVPRMAYEKKTFTNPYITKELGKILSKSHTQTIKDHSTITVIKLIRHYQPRTGTWKLKILTQK